MHYLKDSFNFPYAFFVQKNNIFDDYQVSCEIETNINRTKSREKVSFAPFPHCNDKMETKIKNNKSSEKKKILPLDGKVEIDLKEFTPKKNNYVPGGGNQYQ